MYMNEWTNEYIRRINVKMNILFFAKNTNSKLKKIKQDYYYKEQHHEKPEQLHI